MFSSFMTKVVNFFFALLFVALVVAWVVYCWCYVKTVLLLIELCWWQYVETVLSLLGHEERALYVVFNTVFKTVRKALLTDPSWPGWQKWHAFVRTCYIVTDFVCMRSSIVLALLLTLFGIVGLVFLPVLRLLERYLDLGYGDFVCAFEPAGRPQRAVPDPSGVDLGAAVSSLVRAASGLCKSAVSGLWGSPGRTQPLRNTGVLHPDTMQVVYIDDDTWDQHQDCEYHF